MTIQSVDLPPLAGSAGTQSSAPSQRLAAMAGVRAVLTVVAGHATSSVGEILSLREGEVLTLDRPVNSPFDVMVGGSVIARGELVAVGDQFGIRIVQVAPHETES